MMRQTDPYIRDRLHDLDDLANRLLRVLTGGSKVFGHELPDNTILVARNMGPAELLEYDRRKLRGVVLEEGGMTAPPRLHRCALAGAECVRTGAKHCRHVRNWRRYYSRLSAGHCAFAPIG